MLRFKILRLKTSVLTLQYGQEYIRMQRGPPFSFQLIWPDILNEQFYLSELYPDIHSYPAMHTGYHLYWAYREIGTEEHGGSRGMVRLVVFLSQ